MTLQSIIDSINTDTNETIKKYILEMFNELIDNENLSIDNFKNLVLEDDFYIHKVYMAYIVEGLFRCNFFSALIRFIEKEKNQHTDFVY